jgi:hypothetical protein
MIAALSYGIASIGTGLSAAKVLFTNVKVQIPVRLVLMFVGLLAPLLFIIVCARMCIWFIFDHPLESNRNSYGALQLVELIAWIYFYVELCLSDLLNSAIHSMFRFRIRKSFYNKGADVKLNDLPARPIFLCNATLNNLINKKFDRVYHPFTFSQLHIGSEATGYRRTEDIEVNAKLPSRTYTSFANSVSAAIIAVNQGNRDKVSSSWPLRLTLQLFSINLGVYMRFIKHTILHKSLTLVIFIDYGGLAGCLVAKFLCDYLEYDVIKGFKYLLWAIQIIIIFNIFIMASSLIITAIFDSFKFECPTWFPINMPINDIPLFRSLPQVFGFRERTASRSIFLSDGGHFDELGLYAPLQRKCKIILAFDGIGKSLTNLHHILLEAKKRGLIRRVLLDGKEMDNVSNIGGKVYHTKQNSFSFQVEYNNGTIGTIWYGKSSVCGDEKGILKLQIVSDEKFPKASETDHFLNLYQFDAYRRLGKHVGMSVINKIYGKPIQNIERRHNDVNCPNCKSKLSINIEAYDQDLSQ